MKGLFSILLLIVSNIFMTLAWYGHLQFEKDEWAVKWGLKWILKWGWIGIILLSWGIAFFEYVFQVPANRIGYKDQGGPFSLFELKIIQEAISLTVFSFFAILVFKTDKFNWNYLIGFIFIILAVVFIFRGRNS